jgi:hypothetical protein
MKKLLLPFIIIGVVMATSCSDSDTCVTTQGIVIVDDEDGDCYHRRDYSDTLQWGFPSYADYDINTQDYDFRFQNTSITSPSGYLSSFNIIPLSNSVEFAYELYQNTDSVMLKQFNPGDSISANLNWINGRCKIYHSYANYPSSSFGQMSLWQGTGYAGIRIKQPDNTYKYGWLKISLSPAVFNKSQIQK